MKLTVHLEQHDYPIYIEANILAHAVDYIKDVFHGKRVMIISDKHVYPLYGVTLFNQLSTLYECTKLELEPGEITKSFHSLPSLYAALSEAKVSRSDLVIALGGGVIGDLAGFVAATYLRGVNLIQIPTTLLAQVDSSIGGKVAVDLPQGKNLVGAFYQPKLVLIDPKVLDTLPLRFVNDGMGEVIKYGCVRDAQLFFTLETHDSFDSLKSILPDLIHRCAAIKQTIVERDQFDTGERMLLNFGHTLGHTIEQYYHYQKESHGEAVAIGMYQICRLAESQGRTPPGTAARLLKVLNQYGLPHACGLPLDALTETIALDKKNLGDKLHLVLLREIGNAYIHATTAAFFEPQTAII